MPAMLALLFTLLEDEGDVGRLSIGGGPLGSEIRRKGRCGAPLFWRGFWVGVVGTEGEDDEPGADGKAIVVIGAKDFL